MALRVHYHPTLLARARAGAHNFTNQLRAAMEARGVGLDLLGDTASERRESAARPGGSLVLMHPPLGLRQMVLRLAYIYPFWRIERSDKGWAFEVARTRFDPAQVDETETAVFCHRRRGMHLDGAAPGAGDGTIYVALQGRIRQARSFQTMAPIKMLRRTLIQADGATVFAGLHPKERYGADHAARCKTCARVIRT